MVKPQKRLAGWKRRIIEQWPAVRIARIDTHPSYVGHADSVRFELRAELAGLAHDDVRVECVVSQDGRDEPNVQRNRSAVTGARAGDVPGRSSSRRFRVIRRIRSGCTRTTNCCRTRSRWVACCGSDCVLVRIVCTVPCTATLSGGNDVLKVCDLSLALLEVWDNRAATQSNRLRCKQRHPAPRAVRRQRNGALDQNGRTGRRCGQSAGGPYRPRVQRKSRVAVLRRSHGIYEPATRHPARVSARSQHRNQ